MLLLLLDWVVYITEFYKSSNENADENTNENTNENWHRLGNNDYFMSRF